MALRRIVLTRSLNVRVRVQFVWWSIQNRLKGYKFGPVQRFRCCDHTTPFHYSWCAERADA